jgi:PAS domain-containing protein
MHKASPSTAVRIITIPTTDLAFSQMANRLHATAESQSAAGLETRLRRVFPRAVVRSREIAGEPAAWYVYRDGGWRSSMTGPWWLASDLPRLAVTRDGWLADANATARGLLEIEPGDVSTRHFTDFVAPGGLEDSKALFDIVDNGSDLTATVLLRPSSGQLIAVDLHAEREDELLVGVFRLADDIDVPSEARAPERLPVVCEPVTDAAFRGYVELALSRMAEPTPDGLSFRLRRLYPHAEVVQGDQQWLAKRDRDGKPDGVDDWWTDRSLPAVQYDAQALILAANKAAEVLLGTSLVGHYWQEFVTPGSTEQVSAMLAILADLGRAESRFRMPRADGSLVEFDSYTEVDGELFTTVMRPRS